MDQQVWLPEPEAHDFPAAADYLELLFEQAKVDRFVADLQAAATIVKKAKDIFRASALSLLPKDNKHVQKNLKKIDDGKLLSPILLVRDNGKLIIADGYHRMCAGYYLSEDTEIPCRLVG